MNIRRVIVLAGPLIILLLFGCLFRMGVTAQEPVPSVIQLQPFLSGLTSPILLTNAGDGTNRIFIAEQGGMIKVVQPGSTTPSVFLNITSKVLSGGERGLLGLAFHPQYSLNRRFFVHYSRQPDGVNVIAEYKASLGNPNVADTAETIYLTIPQPFGNHNGGMIEFGPDGFLYIGKGDGGSANDPGNRAQNINELLGKVLRIDVDTPNGPVPYSSPPSNPFFGSTPGRDEIYAVGLRNPWRFSFDRSTGQLYLGDVGQGAREEVDIITLGGNYGWRVFEGTGCTGLDPSLCGGTGYTAPIAEYSHAGGRCSITGGYVYRGTAGSLPSGTYVYADFCTGEIFTFPGSSTTPVLDTTMNISSFGEDEAGELYVVSLGGTVHRLTDSGCSFSISPSSQSFSSAGGNGSIQVATEPGCLWSATTAANFITINSGGGAGGGMATYSVSANPNSTPRSGTITVAGQNFTVNQAGLTGSCVSSLTPASLSVPAGGGSGGTTVGAPTGCSWSAVSNDSWITITSGATGTGIAKVKFAAAANTSTSARVGSVTIGNRTLTLTQAGLSCTFTLGTTSQSFGAAGGTGGVSVTAQAGCNWTAVSNDLWISITGGSSGSGSGMVTYSVGENFGPMQVGTITIAGKTFTVQQAGVSGGGCTFQISPSNQSFPRTGGGGSVNVFAGTGCNWTAVSNSGFIHVTGGASGSGAGTVNYTVDSNPDPLPRSGTITIAGLTFTVNQAGNCSFTISPGTRIMPIAGGTANVSVTTQAGCNWTAVSNVSWITITGGASGTGSGTVTYSVAPNSGLSRKGTVTIAGLTHSVKQ